MRGPSRGHARASRRWTSPADIETTVRRRWNDRTLLQAFAAGEAFPVQDLPLRGPTAKEIASDLTVVRAWIDTLQAGSGDGARYTLTWRSVGGREIGRNQVPDRAQVTSYEQAWSLLGTRAEVQRYERILEQTAAVAAVGGWVRDHPNRALDVEADWTALVHAYRWLEGARGSRRYLREVDAPGVDTKLIDRHRGLLAAWLGVPRQSVEFVTALGLRTKPDLVRLRFEPDALAMPGPITEVTLRLAEAAELQPDEGPVVIVENEITFLSLPVPADGLLIWGKGFDAGLIGSLPWLAGRDVHYWGDLDTHGFAILNQLRAWVPHARSFLMDRATLAEHRDRWGSESSPTRARLDRLTEPESELYDDLVTDRLGRAVRLEQERLDWEWVLRRLPYRAD